MPEVTGRLRTPRLASAPATPSPGEMYYDTAANKLYWWNGTLWVDSTGGGSAALITMDSWHNVGAAGEPAFQNSWVNLGSTYAPMAFRKMPDGTVQVRGSVSNGTSGGAIFTLPVGYRPPRDLFLHPLGDAGAAGNFVGIQTSTGYLTGTRTGANLHIDQSFDTDTVLQTASVASQPLDTWHTVGGAGEPAFQNSWSSVGGAYGPVAFRKDPFGHVSLKGVTSGGASNSVIFTLPTGYRPIVSGVQLPVAGDGGVVSGNVITINSDGTVTGQRAGSFLWLHSVEFDTETVTSYASGVIGPTRVTSLPTSPVDGQEVYFVADATNGVLWHLRYNAASASAYKWEFVGGPPVHAESAASTGVFGGWNGPYTPTLTLARAGDYLVTMSCEMFPASVGTIAMAPYTTGALTTLAAALVGPPAGEQSLARSDIPLAALPAGQAVSHALYTNVTCNVQQLFLSIHPVRVS